MSKIYLAPMVMLAHRDTSILCVVHGYENLREEPINKDSIFIVDSKLFFKTVEDEVHDKIFMRRQNFVVARPLTEDEMSELKRGRDVNLGTLAASICKDVVVEQLNVDCLIEKRKKRGKKSRGTYFNSQKKIKPGKVVKRRR